MVVRFAFRRYYPLDDTFLRFAVALCFVVARVNGETHKYPRRGATVPRRGGRTESGAAADWPHLHELDLASATAICHLLCWRGLGLLLLLLQRLSMQVVVRLSAGATPSSQGVFWLVAAGNQQFKLLFFFE